MVDRWGYLGGSDYGIVVKLWLGVVGMVMVRGWWLGGNG